MSVTLKAIARHTGLAVPTVGAVLGRGAHRYSAATRSRVLKAATELGYRPNSMARAMREGKMGSAALVVSRHCTSYSYLPPGLLDGLDEALVDHDMHLTVSWLAEEELGREWSPPKVLREYLADGLIVNYTHRIPPAMLDSIRTHHTPAVWINAKLDGDCVYPDDFAAAHSTTKRLIEMGHRRIAFVHLIKQFLDEPLEAILPAEHYSVADRIGGYELAMREAGLSPRVVDHTRYVPENEQSLEVCRALLGAPDRPTAVLVYSDHYLSLVMCAAAMAGLQVPGDLSVLVFYPSELWVAGKVVSAVQVPTKQIGRHSVEMLIRKMSAPDTLCPPHAVPYEAVFGSSVAPPPIQR